MQQDELSTLMDKVRNGEASPEDYRLLANAVKADQSGLLTEEIDRALGQSPLASPDEQKWLRMADDILRIDRAPLRRMTFLRQWGWAAACILLLISLGIYFWEQPVQRAGIYVADIAPGSDKALLTLADGTTIPLDSAARRMLLPGVHQQGGLLQYDGSTEVSYNTLSTPRGGQFRIQLPDGTQVWLNAASSIRYPTSFTGKDRRVEVTGEAYFEVAQNAAKPFHVKAGTQTDVEVLGTHFNVNAYADEQAVRTTLLEGAVRVGGRVLRPGQQAQQHAGTTTVSNVNASQVIAWKNGLFDFEDAGLEDVMRQLARWYNLEVVYEGNVPHMQFGGKMSRDLQLSDILDGLKGAHVHFRIEGRKLIVMP